MVLVVTTYHHLTLSYEFLPANDSYNVVTKMRKTSTISHDHCSVCMLHVELGWVIDYAKQEITLLFVRHLYATGNIYAHIL